MWGEYHSKGLYKTVVDQSSRIIYNDDLPDKNIYISWDGIKGSDGNTEGLKAVGTEDPNVDYSKGRYWNGLYQGQSNTTGYLPVWFNDGPIEEDYTLETMFIPVFGWLKCLKFGGKYLWGFWDDFAKVVYKGKTYAKVGGKLYSRHAIDRMVPSALGKAAGGSAGRSVSTNIVEEVIKNGNRTTRLVDGIVRTEHVLGDVHVITEEAGKVVVTVITK